MSATRLLLLAILEPAVRVAGWVARFLGKDQEGAEMVLRGWLLGGSRRWRVGRNVRFIGPPARFRFGRGVTLYGGTYINVNGPNGLIEIGDGSHVDQFCVLYGQGGIQIGGRCAIASGVIVYSQTNADSMQDGTPVALQPTVYAKVRIGEGCWLGAGVRVIPGATIGDGCHVGAGAVVTDTLPPFSVAVGVPAKVVRQRAR
jgi:acetyltransferase-like isoleucine patch superfamily enzyme